MVFTNSEESKESPSHLVPLDMFKVKFDLESKNQHYTVDDLINSIREEDIAKLSAIIGKMR